LFPKQNKAILQSRRDEMRDVPACRFIFETFGSVKRSIAVEAISKLNCPGQFMFEMAA
jgi:hypothetical protein